MSALTANSVGGTYRYKSFPNYYNLDESFMVSSCNITAMKTDEIGELHIPYGVTGIRANVFNANLSTELTSNPDKIDIYYIYLPKTLSVLEDNCFTGLVSVDNV